MRCIRDLWCHPDQLSLQVKLVNESQFSIGTRAMLTTSCNSEYHKPLCWCAAGDYQHIMADLGGLRRSRNNQAQTWFRLYSQRHFSFFSALQAAVVPCVWDALYYTAGLGYLRFSVQLENAIRSTTGHDLETTLNFDTLPRCGIQPLIRGNLCDVAFGRSRKY
jgi:hypothetical protein